MEVLYLADLLACQVWVTADDPGLCCCVPCYTCDVCRTLLWFLLPVDSTQTLRASCLIQITAIHSEAKACMSNWKTRRSNESEHFGNWLDTLHCLPYYNATANSHYNSSPFRMSLVTHRPVIQNSTRHTVPLECPSSHTQSRYIEQHSSQSPVKMSQSGYIQRHTSHSPVIYSGTRHTAPLYTAVHVTQPR